jgi:hypothetical protein
MNPFANLIQGIVNNISKPFREAEQAMRKMETPESFRPSPAVTPALMKQFFDDGFVVVPDAVSLELRNAAKRAINRSLGRGKEALPADSPWRHVPKLISSCPELMLSPNITALFNDSDALGCVQALLGATVNRVWGGQIALRYPGDGCIPNEVYNDANAIGRFIISQGLRVANNQQRKVEGGEFANPNANDDSEYQVIPNWQQSWHIDGWPNPLLQRRAEDGVENFSLLVGVMLSDADAPLMGNLTVYPGSHQVIETCIREAGGPDQLFATDPAVFSGGEAMRDPQSASLENLKKIAHSRLPKPVQVRAKAGDVVIAHYQTAHTIAPNVSSDIRYCIYFRVTHSRRKDKTYCPEAMTNIWLEFDGLRQVLGVPLVRNPPLQIAAAPAASSSASSAARPAVTPEYAAAEAILAEAAKEQAAGHLKIALAMYERGIGAALAARSGLSEAARAATAAQLEESLSAAELIKDQLNSAKK